MTGRVQTLRSNVSGNRPTGRQPGELYVNWADSQIGVINSTGGAQDFVAVRFFNASASYVVGDFVIQGGQLYRAVAPSSGGAFVAANWAQIGGSVGVGDASPSNPQAGTLWWDSVGGQLYVWYNDGNSSQWVVANNAASVLASGYLALSGGTMTGPITLPGNPTTALQSVPKQYVDALPVAMNDNRIINGDMRIDQRNNGSGGTATAVYTADRWYFQGSQTGKGTWQRSGNTSNAVNGFYNYLQFVSSSAYAVVAADVFNFQQRIEADQIADFAWGTANAQPVTLSFWAASSLTGTFGGAISTGAGATRSYPFTYSIPVASTWMRIVITIPGDTAAGWTMNGNMEGARLFFDLGTGSTFRAPASAWASGNYTGANGTVSVVGTNGATFQVTGVKLEIGSVATPFNRQSLAKSLADCQRYYQNCGGLSGAGYTAGAYVVQHGYIFAPMRAASTAVATWGTNTALTPAIQGVTTVSFTISGTTAAAGQWGFNLSSLTLSAEL